jgi:hypothetical protein
MTGTEQWRPVVGFETHYEVSDAGSVRSLDRTFTDSIRRTYAKKGQLLKPSPHPDYGHLTVMLYHDGIGAKCRVHHLVLAAFVGPCPTGLEGCHNDGNPSNNSVGNLRWDTRQSNIDDREQHGRTSRGEDHPGNKLTKERVLELRAKLDSGLHTTRELAKEYGLSKGTLHNIKTRKRWAWLEEPCVS